MALSGIGLLAPAPLQAAISSFPFSARLTTPSGFSVADGSYTITFRLYDDASAPLQSSHQLWCEEHSVTVSRGEFAVYLGSAPAAGVSLCEGSPPLADVDFSHSPLFLGFQVGSDPEMSPRYELGSVPSAFNALKLGGRDSAAYFQKDQNETVSGDTTFTGGLSVQRATGFIGNLIDLSVGGNSRLSVSDAGDLTTAGSLSVERGGAAIAGRLTVISDGTSSGFSVIGDSAITGNLAVSGTLSATAILGALQQTGQYSNSFTPTDPNAAWAIAAQGRPLASTNGALLALGSGPFSGVAASDSDGDDLSELAFAGSASGTLLGGNTTSGFIGNLIDLQVRGQSKFRATATGAVTTASTLTITSGDMIVSSGGISVSGSAVIGGSLSVASVSSPGALSLASTGVNPVTLSTNAAERLRVTGEGKVGINTTGPQAQVDIESNLNTQLRLGYDASNATTLAVDATGRLTLAAGGSGSVVFGGSNAELLIRGDGAIHHSSGTFFIESVTGKNLVLQQYGGSVGVGVMPTAKLDINGDLKVSSGASISGGLNNNSGGITNTGALSGATTGTFSGVVSAGSLDSAGAIRLGVAGANNTLNTAAANGSTSAALYWGNQQLVTDTNLGSFGVASLNGLTGTLALANATGSGSTITINNAAADGSTKGIASFNGTNFTASAGVINTVQDIATSATPSFAGLTLAGPLSGTSASFSGTISGTMNPGLTPGSIIFQGASGLTQDNANFFFDDANNRVGIGTASPAAKLNIHQLDGAPALIISRESGPTFDITNGTNITFLGTTTNHDIGFYTNNGTNKLTIKAAGNVGIGQNSPGSLLSVNNNLSVGSGYATTAAPSNGAIIQGSVGIGTTSPSNLLTLGASSSVISTDSSDGSDNKRIVIAGGGAYNSTRGAYVAIYGNEHTYPGELQLSTGNVGDMLFYTGADQVRMRITSAGNVGIGLSPSYKLDVNGDINIASGSNYKINGANINTAGSLSNVAYLNQANTFTQTNTFSNATYSALFTGGNVGIGTSDPTARLQVNASAAGTVAVFKNVGTGAGQLDIGTSAIPGGASAYIASVDGVTSGLSFRTRNSSGVGDRVVIDKDGNVGIGTTGPTSSLVVMDGNNNGGADIRYIKTNNTAAGYLLQRNQSGGSFNESWYMWMPASSTDLRFQGGGVDRFVIQNTGNVGIGTTSPGSKLEISDNSTNPYGALKVKQLNASGYGLSIVPGSDSGFALIINNAADAVNRHIFYGNGNVVLANGAGNVGIGTSSPQAILQTGTGSDAPGFGSASTTAFYGTFNGQTDLFLRDSTNDIVARLTADPSTSGVLVGSATNHFLSLVTNNTTRMKIENDGRVTFASSPAPDGKFVNILAVAGLESLNITGAANQRTLRVTGNSTSGQSYGIVVDAGTNSSDQSLLVRDATATSTYLVVRGDGNVGIGTTGPSYRLDVQANAADYAAQIRNTNAGGYGLLIRPGSDSVQALQINDAGASAIRHSFFGNGNVYLANGAGNVGIGTTNPGAKLEVAGSGTLSGTLGVGISAPTAYQAYIHPSATNIIGLGIAARTGQTSALQYWLKSDGNVGLAVSPMGVLYSGGASLSLSVNDNSLGALSLVDSSYWSDNVANMWWQSSGRSNLVISGGSGAALDRLGILSSGVHITTGNPTAPTAMLEVSGTAHLRGANGATGLVVTSGSNVGIGTTSPKYPLDIVQQSSPELGIRLKRNAYSEYTAIYQVGGANIASTGAITLIPSATIGDNSVSGSAGLTVTSGSVRVPWTSSVGPYYSADTNHGIRLSGSVSIRGLEVFTNSGYGNDDDITLSPHSSVAVTVKSGTGNVGIGTTGPDRKLDILDTANPQVRLTHTDGSVYTDLQTTSSGNLNLLPSGGKVSIGAVTTPNGTLDVRQSAIGDLALYIKGIASATADVIRVEDSAGNLLFAVDITGKLASGESLPGVPIIGVDPNSGTAKGDLTSTSSPLKPSAGSGLTLDIAAGSAYTANAAAAQTKIARCNLAASTTLTLTDNATEYVYVTASGTASTTGITCQFGASTTVPAYSASRPVLVIAKTVTSGGSITSVADIRFFIGGSIDYSQYPSGAVLEPGSIVILDTAGTNQVKTSAIAGDSGVAGIVVVGNPGTSGGQVMVMGSGSSWAQATSTTTVGACAGTSTTAGLVTNATANASVCAGQVRSAASPTTPSVLVRVSPY